MWSPVYIDQGLRVQNYSSIGANSPTNLDEWMEKTFINQNGHLTTTGTLSASNVHNKSQVDGLLANKSNASDVFTNSQVGGMLPSLLYGVIKFYEDDTGTGRGVISRPTAGHFACTQSINSTGTPILMTMTPDAGVVVYTALSVSGNVYAPSMYNKDQVDYIASTRQATVTYLTSFNALNINASGDITDASTNTDGTVVALNINTGAINASSLNDSSGGSIITPHPTLSNGISVCGYITLSCQHVLKRYTMKSTTW